MFNVVWGFLFDLRAIKSHRLLVFGISVICTGILKLLLIRFIHEYHYFILYSIAEGICVGTHFNLAIHFHFEQDDDKKSNMHQDEIQNIACYLSISISKAATLDRSFQFSPLCVVQRNCHWQLD